MLWALKQSTHFSIFERFEILHLPDLLVPLAPPQPSVTNFDVFSVCFPLIYSFLLYIQGGSSLVNACIQIHTVQSCTANRSSMSFVWGPPSHISIQCSRFHHSKCIGEVKKFAIASSQTSFKLKKIIYNTVCEVVEVQKRA